MTWLSTYGDWPPIGFLTLEGGHVAANDRVHRALRNGRMVTEGRSVSQVLLQGNQSDDAGVKKRS